MQLTLNQGCFLLLLFIFSACGHHPLVVQMQYLSRNSLASYYVDTPDPKLENPDIGQQLIVNWFLPKNAPTYQKLYLHIKIRFHNREEITRSVTLNQSSGTYVYTILNKEFFNTRGILTYKVQLIGDDKIVDEWQHQLWTDLIILQK